MGRQILAGSVAVGMGVDGMFGATDDWLALPFDASMAPFAPGDVPGFEDARLDFIWTLPL